MEAPTRRKLKRYLTDLTVELPRSTQHFRSKYEEDGTVGDLDAPNVCDNANGRQKYLGSREVSMLLCEPNISSYVDECSPCDDNSTHANDTNHNTDIYKNLPASVNEEPLFTEEDNDDDIFAEAYNVENEELLYPGSHLTYKQSEALILSYAARYHLSEIALRDLLLLINTHTPDVVHQSKYYFLKSIQKQNTVEYHFYCKHCKATLQFLNEPTAQCSNPNCHFVNVLQEKVNLRQEGCFFLYMPLAPQITALMNNYNFVKKLERNRANSDITTGHIYTGLQDSGDIGPLDITIQWNTDGASATKSSKCSIWPIQVAINELFYRDRRDNILLTSLWQGDKPHMQTFLRPFVDELQDLHLNGIQLANGTNIKIHCLLATVDSVARPLLQNLKQFNGAYGCSFCLNPGLVIPRGNGTSRVYCGLVDELRTEEQHFNCVTLAVQNNTCVDGVKGPSLVMAIPLFNIISSFVPDYLHSVLLGVVRWFMLGWLNGANVEKEWYLGGEKSKIISARLLSIMPPSEVTRPPRSLDDLKLMKGSEFRSFLLYYSLSCLHGLLPVRYLKHWMLLVFAITTFLKEKINVEDFHAASNALEKFVTDTENLYGREWMTFNLHLLLHLPESVKNWGALWSYSTFMFEHYNGVLLNFFSGTQHISAQILKNYERTKHMEHILGDFPYQRWHPMAETLLKKLSGNLLSLRAKQFNFLVVFGAPKIKTLNITEQIALEEFLGHEVTTLNYQTFNRFIYKGIKLNTSNYTRLRKRQNSIVRLNDDCYIQIDTLLLLAGDLDMNKHVVIGRRLTVLPLDICSTGLVKSRSFLKIIDCTDDVVVTYPDQISSKCVKFCIDDKVFLCEIVNQYERD